MARRWHDSFASANFTSAVSRKKTIVASYGVSSKRKKVKAASPYEREKRYGMITRIWRGWTTPENAAAYERLLRSEIFPSIASRQIAGYRGFSLGRRDHGDEVEFLTSMWFESNDAVKAFAGENYEIAVVPPTARAVLSRFDERATHYVTVVPPPQNLA